MAKSHPSQSSGGSTYPLWPNSSSSPPTACSNHPRSVFSDGCSRPASVPLMATACVANSAYSNVRRPYCSRSSGQSAMFSRSTFMPGKSAVKRLKLASVPSHRTQVGSDRICTSTGLPQRQRVSTIPGWGPALRARFLTSNQTWPIERLRTRDPSWVLAGATPLEPGFGR
jgi:hypothetical protein